MNIQSRLLKRLDADIAAAETPVGQACLKVQRALLFARHGQMGVAREQLTKLHQLAFQHPNSELGAWLHFAEGLMSYYTDFSGAAQEKIKRAEMIARSINSTELEAFCAAWLAQLAYIRHEVDEMVVHAQRADLLAAADNHAARFRLCTAVGIAYHFANEPKLANLWYAKAREHALAEGDDASLSALMYNMAQMRTSHVRCESLASRSVAHSGLLLGADSINNYDAAMGGSVKPGLTPVLQAQILTVEGEYSRALELFEKYLPDTMATGLARLGSSLLADLAWCRVNLGQLEHASKQANEAELEIDPSCDVDDRAATHSRLAQIYSTLGYKGKAERHANRAEVEWREFAIQQSSWAHALADAGLQPR